MDHAKSIFASKTAWANVIGLACLVSPGLSSALTGVDVGVAAEAIAQTVAGLMFIASTIFRLTATKQLKI